MYRWNESDLAAGYDRCAELIHPYYVEMQDAIIELLPFADDAGFLLVDAGGGSGRLMERVLERFACARAIVIDQSTAFIALANKRLERFHGRAETRVARLQDDWPADLGEQPAAIVSMSAIHHLDADEKRSLYQRCHALLRAGGVFLNADEIRPDDDGIYLDQCRAWAGHMRGLIDRHLVPQSMAQALLKWEERNVKQFGRPRISGDDCHETVESQLALLGECGFAYADSPWRKDMWAIMRGQKT
jgi:tRNA (cmo5U34)-methyltransferase